MIPFVELKTTKKGNLGESLLDEWLISNGYIPYAPISEGAHPFDRLCAKVTTKEIVIVDAKAKARRTYYPDTGINHAHYLEYKKRQVENNLDIFLFFIDEHEKSVYGNLLSVLEEPIVIAHNGNDYIYPLIQKNYAGIPIVYFPLIYMRDMFQIDEETARQLKDLSSRNCKYPQEVE